MKHDNHKVPHLTQAERAELRDKIALRVLPYCLMVAEQHHADDETLLTRAQRAVDHAHIIADEYLAKR